MTSRKPLGDTHGVAFATVRDGGDDGWHIECRFEDGQKYAPITVDRDNELLADAIAGFLSSKAPPPDAEVREAVEWLEGFRRCTAGNNAIGRKDFILEHIETLLRAVQSPRLTGEQMAVLRMLYRRLDYGRVEEREKMDALVRAAFPEALEVGEVGE